MEKAVVVLSGGLDSAVALAFANNAGYQVSALHVNYGQRTELKELNSFNLICGHFGVFERLVADIGYLKAIGGSSLTDGNIPIEKGGVDPSRIPSTYVPFRNTHLLSIAVSWAEVKGASKIFIGAVEEDSSGYPDCRKGYFEKFNELLAVALVQKKVTVETPLIDLNKGDIVKLGIKLGVPFELTWSCYGESEEACGVCDSCRLRLNGFKAAGVADPIRYAH
ncbi:MAG: 7-cyano-7-deazaguanine synthase QueC [Deferribacteraceae bacterium]|jgi:7-cyano-7-deazaguanine synthase|nr:7-cyano-7-deazaguanine synthase QueC [Deferribacteraceae bacterium]